MSFRFILLIYNQSYSLIGLYIHQHWAEPTDLSLSKPAFLRNELLLFRVWQSGKKLFHLKRINQCFILGMWCSRQWHPKLYEIQNSVAFVHPLPNTVPNPVFSCAQEIQQEALLWFMFGISQRDADCLI